MLAAIGLVLRGISLYHDASGEDSGLGEEVRAIACKEGEARGFSLRIG